MFEILDRRTSLTGNQIKILTAAIIGDALEFFDYFLIGFVLAFLIGPWKLTFGQSAVVLMSSGIGAIMGAYIWGWLADRIGRRKVFIGTVLNFSIATGLLYFTPDNGWIYLSVMRFFVGLGVGGLYCVDLPLVQEFMPSSIVAGYNYDVMLMGVSAFWLLLAVTFFFADGGFAMVGPYAAEVWPSHLRTSGMGSAYGFGGIGKIIGPVGLALIVGSGNYLKPDVPLPEIPLAFVYLGCWFLMAGAVYYFLGIETRGKSIEQIDRELAVTADLSTATATVRQA